jgi:hypothetical protein
MTTHEFGFDEVERAFALVEAKTRTSSSRWSASRADRPGPAPRALRRRPAGLPALSARGAGA